MSDNLFNTGFIPLFNLPLTRIRIAYKTTTAGPPDLAKIRGKLGYHLKRSQCVHHDFRRKECGDCLVTSGCPYVRLFAPASDGLRIASNGGVVQQPDSVRPFVLGHEDTRGHEGNERFKNARVIGFTLFQPAIDNLDLFTNAAVAALGDLAQPVMPVTIQVPAHRRDPAETTVPSGNLLEWVAASFSERPPIPSKTYDLKLILDTPLRPFKKRSSRETLDFVDLVKVILRRLRDLKRAYGPDADMGDFPESFFTLARDVTIVENDLRWTRRNRYSHSQQKSLHLDGFTGSIVYRGPVGHFLPLLLAGEIVHVGRGTSCGNGRMHVAQGRRTGGKRRE